MVGHDGSVVVGNMVKEAHDISPCQLADGSVPESRLYVFFEDTLVFRPATISGFCVPFDEFVGHRRHSLLVAGLLHALRCSVGGGVAASSDLAS
jgi:hypothetical protein